MFPLAERWEDAAKIYQAILIHHRDGLTDARLAEIVTDVVDLRPRAIIERASGKAPSEAPLMQYLEDKFSALYGL